MNNQQFCYWLQGFVELSSPTVIRSSELQTIRDHLDIVQTEDRGGFTFWLDGFLSGDQTQLDAHDTQIVIKRLSKEFLDVIDLSYGNKSNTLNMIHNPRGRTSFPEAMC